MILQGFLEDFHAGLVAKNRINIIENDDLAFAVVIQNLGEAVGILDTTGIELESLVLAATLEERLADGLGLADSGHAIEVNGIEVPVHHDVDVPLKSIELIDKRHRHGLGARAGLVSDLLLGTRELEHPHERGLAHGLFLVGGPAGIDAICLGDIRDRLHSFLISLKELVKMLLHEGFPSAFLNRGSHHHFLPHIKLCLYTTIEEKISQII